MTFTVLFRHFSRLPVSFHSNKISRRNYINHNKKQDKTKTATNQENVFYITCHYGAVVLGVLLILTERFVSCTGVTGYSMQPTINPHQCAMRDWVLMDKRVVKNHSIVERGDIVTYKTVQDPSKINIKRVVALEGDTVTTLGYKIRNVTIPPGYCWVEGDNHLSSDDSNKRGPIPVGLITGRAVAIIFPISRWQWLLPKLPHSRIKLNPNCEPSLVKYLPAIHSPEIYSRRR